MVGVLHLEQYVITPCVHAPPDPTTTEETVIPFTLPNTDSICGLVVHGTLSSPRIGEAGEVPPSPREKATCHTDISRVAPLRKATVHGFHRLASVLQY